MSAAPSNSLAPVPPMIGGGEMGDLVRDTDWSSTALSDYRSWPASLRTALSLVLNTKGIAALYWGPQQWLLYNDAYGLALGDRHPAAFGRPMPEVLTDIASVLSPQVAQVLATGDGFSIENLSMMMRRHRKEEETVWTYSFSPVQGESGGYEGVLPLDILVDPAGRAADQRCGPRLHRRAGERQRLGRRRGSPASIAEAGSHRPTHRWRRPRLQQPADRNQVVD